ncbi:MAG: hypothetical protein ACFE7R_10045 [Candidatus Hodarchaeota archaeon]
MTDTTDRKKFLHAIKKCLSDAHGFFSEAMDILDEMNRASIATGMTPLVGGYAMKNEDNMYRDALFSVDAAEKALQPLAKRFNDGRVNASHFEGEETMIQLKDLLEFNYGMLVALLSERKGRETVWYRLKELSEKTESIFRSVSND